MNAKHWVVASVVIGTLSSMSAQAKLFRWVDDQGTTHFGETIPPEYAEKSNVQLNEKGRVIKKNQVVTEADKRAKAEEDAKKNAEQQALRDQKRKDRALLQTYSSEKEIDLARDRNLQQVDAKINSVRLLQQSAQDNLASYRREAETLTRTGKPIPASLKSDILTAEGKIEKLKQELLTAEAKAASVKANAETEKARYRELTKK